MTRRPPKRLKFYRDEDRRHPRLKDARITAGVAWGLTRQLIEALGLPQLPVVFLPVSRHHYYQYLPQCGHCHRRGWDDPKLRKVIAYSERRPKHPSRGIRVLDVVHEVAHYWQDLETDNTWHGPEMAKLVDLGCEVVRKLIVIHSAAARKKS